MKQRNAETVDAVSGKSQPAPSKLIASAFVLKVALLIWLGVHGFPRNTGDAIIYPQPAQMFVRSGVFSLPTAEGWLPYADQLYAGNTPLYTLVSVPVFWLFGFSYQSCLWLDIVIHLLTTVAVFHFIRRLGANILASMLFVILSSFLLLPRGRPEELGVLCGISAVLYVLAVRSPKWSVAGIMLGLSVASHITTGVVATTLLFVFLARRSDFAWGVFVRSSLFILVAQALTVVVCFAPFFWRAPENAMQQFIFHSTHHYRPDIITMLAHFPAMSVFLCVAFLATVALLLSAVKSLRELQNIWRESDPLLMVNLWSVLIVLTLFFTRSQPNHFRFVLYILLGLGSIQLLSRISGPKIRWQKWIASAFVMASLVANEEIVRYVFAPLTWKGEDSQNYSEAASLIQKLVPTGSSVGGDGVGWEMIQNGKPFLSFPWYRGQRLPEYLMSTTFWGCGGEPRLFMNPAMKSFVAQHYEVIRLPKQTGCEFSLFGVEVPISRSSCDWRVSLWKLKSNQP